MRTWMMIMALAGCGDDEATSSKEAAPDKSERSEGSQKPEVQKDEPAPPPLPSEIAASTDFPEAMGGPLYTDYQTQASTELKEKRLTHAASRLHDQKNSTAWCEGLDDDGIGQWVEISAPCSEGLNFTGLGVVPGYASKASTFAKNNRVSEAKVTVRVADTEHWSGTVRFADLMAEQWVDLGKFECPAGSQVTARLEIAGVHAGSKYKDTCMSEMAFYESSQVSRALVRGPDSCKVGAWSTDKDPAGLNVRSGPGKEYPVLGTLIRDEMAIEFTLVEARPGWFRIKNPDSPMGSSRSMPEEGWVASSMVGTGLVEGPVTIRSEPDTSSDGTRFEWGHDVAIKQIESCQDDWLKLSVEDPHAGKKASGWLTRNEQCLNQFTVCGN